MINPMNSTVRAQHPRLSPPLTAPRLGPALSPPGPLCLQNGGVVGIAFGRLYSPILRLILLLQPLPLRLTPLRL